MQTKTQNLLPKTLTGTVHAQFVKCGKPNCKCSRGELHGAYYYHFIRQNGKLRKRYLKASEVEAFQAACAARQMGQKESRVASESQWRNLREIRELLRSTHLPNL